MNRCLKLKIKILKITAKKCKFLVCFSNFFYRKAMLKQFDDKWIVEMAIPFKSLRFKSGVDTWRINFSRNDLKRNENSVWAPVPRNFNVASLAFTGKMKFNEPQKKTSSNISIIPYLTGGVSRDYLTQKKEQYTYNGGLDAKIALSSSLNS